MAWKPAPFTVADLIDCIFEENRTGPGAGQDLPTRFLNFAQKG